MAKWKYKGEEFDLPDDLSAADATARIKEIIQDRNVTTVAPPEADPTAQFRTPSEDKPKRVDAGTDIAKGVFSGATKIAQGTLETFGTYADLKFGMGDPLFAANVDQKVKEGEMVPPESPLIITDTLTKAFDEGREFAGLEPQGTAGKVAEALTQFGVPGYYGAKLVQQGTRIGRKEILDRFRTGASRLSRRQKLTLLGQQAAGAVGVDFIASTDDTQGLHDFFELGPNRTAENKVGETAMEAGAFKLIDKMMIGAEAGVATIVLPPILGAFFKGISKIGAFRPVQEASRALENRGLQVPLANYVPQSLAKRSKGATIADIATLGAIPAARAGMEAATQAILKREARILDPETAGSLTAFDKALAGLFANLRYRGFLDPQAANINSLVNAAVEGDIKIAERKLRKIENKITEYLNRPEVREQTAITKQSLMNAFMDVLETGRRPEGIPDELFNSYREARNVIDSLSEKLLDTGAVRALPETAAPGRMSRQQLMEVIRENIETGGYLRQRYAAYENPKYEIAPGTAREREIFDMIKNMRGANEEQTAFNSIKEILKDDNVLKVTEDQTIDTLTERQMRGYIQKILSKTPSGLGKNPGFSGRVPIRKLNTQLLNRRKVASPVLKEILGQTRNPTESYIATVSDLSTFIANDAFYTRLRQIADADIADATFRRGKYGEEFATANERAALADIREQNPAATINAIGPKQYSRYIDVEQRIVEKKDELSMQLNEAVQRGADEGTLRRLQREIDDVDERVIGDLKLNGYHVIGRMDANNNIIAKDPGQAESKFGAMHNIAVPNAMWQSLSRKVYEDDSFFGLMPLVRHTYGAMLKLKGIAQFNKTILSPITQVRNVTSASMFALAQGNVGSGASLGQSVDIIIRDLVNRKMLGADLSLTDEGLDYLVDLQRRGVIGSSAELREIQDNLRKGSNPLSKQPLESHVLTDDVATTPVGGALDKTNRRNKMYQFLGKAADFYRAGDDLWKIYNYEFEIGKLKNAHTNSIRKLKDLKDRGKITENVYQQRKALTEQRFREELGGDAGSDLTELIKDAAADRVRNLVPNYELVPQVIKDIRGMPFGNFIAFPAEIMRTGYNTLETSMKELASDNPEIREIGMRRLMSSLGTFYVAGPTLRDTAMTLTGTSQDQMEAMNALAAPFQRNSTFIPLGKNEDGHLTAIDYSHFNPYDMLIRPFEALLNSLDESNRLARSDFDTVYNAGWQSFKDFVEPFAGESIAFSAIFDVLPENFLAVGRGGKTRTGAKIYKDAETFGKKLERSLIHVLNQIGPTNLLPTRVPVGADFSEVELSRLPRSLFAGKGNFGLSEVNPSNGVKYTPHAEVFRALTGINIQTIDPKRIAEFKANEFKAARSEASTLFNDMVNREFSDEEDYINGYLAANQARLKAFRQMASHMKHLRALGLSKSKLRKILKDEGVGSEELKFLEQGRYLPYTPSKAKMEEAKKRKHDVPNSTLRMLERDLYRLRIDPDRPKSAPEGAFDNPRDTSITDMLQQQAPQINTDTFMMQSQPVPAPQPPVPQPPAPGPQSMAPQAVTPSALNPIVNPNPQDLALAQILAQRQRRVG